MNNTLSHQTGIGQKDMERVTTQTTVRAVQCAILFRPIQVRIISTLYNVG